MVYILTRLSLTIALLLGIPVRMLSVTEQVFLNFLSEMPRVRISRANKAVDLG